MTENIAPAGSRKKHILAIIIIAAVAVAGFIIYMQLNQMTMLTGGEVPETIVLTKTDLENKVTASGNFLSTDPVTVGSNVQAAEVEYVFVEVGSRVFENDVLAKLKTSDIERSITDSEASIADVRRTEAQQRDAAQRAVNEANDQYSADDRQTQNAINNAQAAVNAAPAAIEDAQVALAAANEALADFITANPGVSPDDPNYVRRLNAVTGAQTALTQAETALTQAQTALSQAQTTRENTLRASNSRRVEAQAQLDSLNSSDSTRQQRSQLEQLKENLDNSYITSPSKGIVTQVNTEAGMAAIGTMFVIENTETLQITASIAEFDVIKIEPGMRAHVTSNATGDTVYEGIVDFVAPVASGLSGNFEIKVLVTSPIGQLKPGMTATVEIVADYKNDIFAVPIDAVVKKPDGTKAVYVYEGGFMATGPEDGAGGPVTTGPGGRQSGGGQIFIGQPVDGPQTIGSGTVPGSINGREIVVKTGMETDFFVEIISDELKEGMLILSDPMGRNVRASGDSMFGMMGPTGGAVRVDTAESGQSGTQTYVAR
jgi:multidrug efflux pump subunit AcrA (membrane-fusion protein)